MNISLVCYQPEKCIGGLQRVEISKIFAAFIVMDSNLNFLQTSFRIYSKHLWGYCILVATLSVFHHLPKCCDADKHLCLIHSILCVYKEGRHVCLILFSNFLLSLVLINVPKFRCGIMSSMCRGPSGELINK